MPARTRPYLFYDVAISICSTCYRKVEAKIVFQDDRVCCSSAAREHGAERVLIADDVDYYRRCREVFIKPPEMPLRYNTPVKWGCPYDCGLCTDHEQHSCLSLVEISDDCNLRCPICYAASGPDRPVVPSRSSRSSACSTPSCATKGSRTSCRSPAASRRMHPEFFEILDLAKARPIRHLMVNTNGVRIAESEAFAERLAGYMPDFEVYLQFDSFERDALMDAARRRSARRPPEGARAAEPPAASRRRWSSRSRRASNDHEIGRIIDFALEQPCVRGVTFQPVQDAGRAEGFDPATRPADAHRSPAAHPRADDGVPAGRCDPGALPSRFAGDGVRAENRRQGHAADRHDRPDSPDQRRPQHDRLRAGRRRARRHRSSCSPRTTRRSRGADSLRDLLCCLPRVAVPDELGYENMFRVIIMQFIDAHAFDVRSVKKTASTSSIRRGRLIPFDTYNLFYRDASRETCSNRSAAIIFVTRISHHPSARRGKLTNIDVSRRARRTRRGIVGSANSASSAGNFVRY